jgi:hypothetical protein
MKRVIFVIAVLIFVSARAQASCLSISSPASGAQIAKGSSVTVQFSDTCSGHWFECLVVDGVNSECSTPNPQAFVWNTAGYVLGNHAVSVRSWTTNGGSLLGSASITVDLVSTAPTPTPTAALKASPTPAPTSSPAPNASPTATPDPPAPTGHYSMMGPNASLPSESACAAAVSAAPEPENAPWNANDGTGYNSNTAIQTTPSYFYQNAGSQIRYPNADFAKVDGNYAGTTDDIMRVYSCKWGEDENWMRAQSMVESGWHQDCADMHGGSGCNENGDNNNPDGSCSGLPAGISDGSWPVISSGGDFIGTDSAGGASAAASWSIIQSKAACAEWYSWPMLALSTSWGEDYEGAKWRSCMNGHGNFGSSAYTSDVSNAASNPNGAYSGGEPKYLGSGETNLDHLAMGCAISHFSGGWFDSGASSYADQFVSTLNSHSWPGGLH